MIVSHLAQFLSATANVPQMHQGRPMQVSLPLLYGIRRVSSQKSCRAAPVNWMPHSFGVFALRKDFSIEAVEPR